MKRLIIVLILVIFAGAGFGYWWYLRDSPQKVLRDGVKSLDSAIGAGQIQATIAITDPKTGSTSGYSFLGELESKDVTRAQLLGVLRIGAKTTTESDQTVDVVLTSDQVAIRPRNVNREYQELSQKYTGDASGETFILADRDVFFNKLNYPAAVGLGASDDVRAAFAYALPALIVDGPLETITNDGGDYASVNFRFDRSATAPFLIDLIRAWRKATSTVEEYAWIDRAAQGLTRGNFNMVLDSRSRQVVRLSGNWPMFNEQGEEQAKLNVTIDFLGLNQSVVIDVPAPVKDITDLLSKRTEPTTLPSSALRPGVTTGTETLQPSQEERVIQKPEIDLFNKYSEELKKKSLY